MIFHSPFLEKDSEVRKDRRHLPHWRLGGSFCFLTWRLFDSLPQEKLKAWRAEKQAWLMEHPKPWDTRTTNEYRERFPKRLDAWLDAGYGACYLRDPVCARIVANALHFFDGERYDLASFVVMPNHVHVLMQLRGGTELESLTHSLKSYSAQEINKLLERRGAFWQQEGFDHLLRGIPHLDRCLSYIQQNPEKAHLKPGEYLYYEAPKFRDFEPPE
ncbi:MAG: transposase [Candidatus Hydrogenedentes bacterium]|nr:transposase [Candidatus Hydrogenedentota bacterium]